MASIKSQSLAIVTDSAKLSTLIKSLATRGKALDRDLNIAAASALHHAYEFKSTAHAETLLAAMAASSRKNALKVWLMDLGPFMVKEDGKTLGIDKDKHSAGFAAPLGGTGKSKREVAMNTPFWKYTEEPQADSPVVAMDLVRKLLDKLSKARSAGKLDADSISVLEKLEKVAPSIEPASV